MSPSTPTRFAKLLTFWRQLREMPSAYHGSNLVYIWSRGVFLLRQTLKRQRAPRMPSSSESCRFVEAYNAAIARQDWYAALPLARGIANFAERDRQPELMMEMSSALTRLADYGQATRLALAARHIRPGKRADEWNGEDITDKILLIELTENAKQSLGRVIRHAQMIPAAARRAKHCIVLVEARLVPTFQRSFPGVDIRADGDGNDAARAEADVFASFHQLAFVFAKDADSIRQGFVPLRADKKLSGMFRSQYAKAGTPLIGLSWGSKSYNKDVPSLTEWSRLIASEQAQFVSLQYGKVPVDLPLLTANHPDRMIHDASVDQLKDMDRFAAQICALDAVISISNTAAHFAGALNVPAIFVIDDKFHTNWPVIGEAAPWYPRGKVILKRGRAWKDVLDEVKAKLPIILRQQ